MVIVLGFYKRDPKISQAEFRRIWTQEYGPLYSSNPDIAKYMKRYVQHLLDPVPGYEDSFCGYDGFSESWYESIEDRNEMKDTSFYKDVLRPIGEKIIDSKNILSAFDDQIIQIAGNAELLNDATR